jgi:hypothetical protein
MHIPIRRYTVRNILSVLVLFVFSATFAQKELYRSTKYTLYDNKVVQGKYSAVVKSPTNIISDYQSTASQVVPRHIVFKFSINEKDVEMKPGDNHEINISAGHISPIMKFGTTQKNETAAPGQFLPENYKYTFRVDMNDVLRQFREKGFYTAYDGSRIAKADFKGFYIAGAAEPLSWDFSNLDEKNLKLQDPDNDGIYEITVVLNPVDTNAKKIKEWKLSRDISSKPIYTSSQPIVDALFKLSTEEALINIEPDSTFRTGAKWGGVWTRDISYSIILAFAYHQPDVAKISLMKKVKRDRIVQDTGSGGAWPVSSDREIWAVAAWEVYKATGDQVWLEKSFAIIKNSLDDDNKTLRDPLTGMYRGESSFLDWREQTYPKWMTNTDIFVSENLGTNAVHYQAHKILAMMGKLLGKEVTAYEKRAEEIKEGINRQLWMKDKGYYAQYLYGRYSLTPSPRFEALGEALTILFGIADEARAKEIMARSPLTDFGATCIYPQIPGIPPYHNNAVWPFVQSYWNLAAAKAQNEDVLNHGLAAIYRAGGLFLTNYENFVADNGDYVGTEINSDRMLWSMAGNLAMVHRIFMGMDFREMGILFHPVVPKSYDGKKTLANFKYRKAILTITVIGHGNQIASFTIDGKASKNPFFPGSLRGSHTIEIRLKNNDFTGAINLVSNHFTLPNPMAKIENNSLKWETIPDAKSYNVYKNGNFEAKVTTTSYAITFNIYAEYKVSAVDEKGYESFTSEPVTVYPADALQLIELEDFMPAATRNYTNYSGKGFVETTKAINREITFKVNAADDGNYFIDFRYSNGNGPWNTENKCAIRSLYINTYYAGVIVMPQRGKDEWSDWGYSNSNEVSLKRGDNTITIRFEDWNNNMNVEENTAMIDYCRVIRMQ